MNKICQFTTCDAARQAFPRTNIVVPCRRNIRSASSFLLKAARPASADKKNKN